MNEHNAQDQIGQLQMSSLMSRAKRDPAHTLAELEQVLGQTGDSVLDDVEQAVAGWAQGVALFEMGRNGEAIQRLSAVVESAPQTVSDRAGVSLAAAQAAGGQVSDAMKRLDDLMERPDPTVRALASSQLGLLYLHRGDLRRSLSLLDTALPVLRSDPTEEHAVGRVLNNVGMCHLLLGEMRQATQPLAEAIEIANRTGQTSMLAAGLQNLGYAEARLGNVVLAIERLERARQIYSGMGNATRRNLATLFEDMSETYRFAGLAREALRYARLASWAVRDGDNIEKQTDAEYQRARCLLDSGDHRAALACAERTRHAYLACDRPLQARRVEHFVLEATELFTPITADFVQRAQHAADELQQAGWNAESLATRIRLAELLAADDQSETAIDLLPNDAHPQTELPLIEQLQHTFAEALACHLRNEPADAALAHAWTVLRDHSVDLVNPELRIGAAAMSERFRSLSLAQMARRNDGVGAVLSEERWRSLWRVGPMATSKADGANAESLIGALGPDRLLVQWGVAHEQLYRLQVGADESSVTSCGRIVDVTAQAAEVQRLMARMLRPGLSRSASANMALAIATSSAELGDTLGIPRVDGQLVVSPPGDLVELPWRLIAPDQAVQLVPNASALSRDGRRVDPSTASLIEGPGLAHAKSDVAAFRGSFPSGRVLQGDDATALGLGELMQQSSFLHVAAHGKFRADSPLFSSIELHDGPAMLHQLDLLTQSPAVVIFGVCEGGRGQSMPGGERNSVAAALFDIGTDCVVAPICAVPDRDLAAALGAFYRALPGRAPHEALAHATPASPQDDPRLWATAHATQCLGVGTRSPLPTADGIDGST